MGLTSGTVAGTNLGATTGANEASVWSAAGAGVWYRWTAPANGSYIFEVTGDASLQHPMMDLGTGTTLGTGNATDFSDLDWDGGSAATATLSFNFAQNGVYTIYIAGYKTSGLAEQGNFTLKWRQVIPPANDNFRSASLISGVNGGTTGTNLDATTESGEPNGPNATVWYKWFAPNSGRYTFDTLGSSFDTWLSVWQGTVVSNLHYVADNNDSTVPGSAGASELYFDAVGGQLYYIAVDGAHQGSQYEGPFVLHWARQQESVVQFAASTYRVDEYAGSVRIPVVRTSGLNNMASVQFTTTRTPGTAKPNVNYRTTTSSLTFAANQTVAYATIPILKEATAETGPIYFRTTLIYPGPMVLLGARKETVVTICDDDALGGLISFSALNYPVSEFSGKATITVNRVGKLTRAVTVKYNTVNATALAPSDYTTKTGTLTFAAGQKSATFTVPIRNDGLHEVAETFFVQLTAPGNGAALGAKNIAAVTIAAH